MSGLGFRRGAYHCVCSIGFFFPNISSPYKFFDGMGLERLFANVNASHDNTSRSRKNLSDYQCIKCAAGCEDCEDATPCLYHRNFLVRWAVLLVTAMQIIIAITFSILVGVHSSEKVIFDYK